MRARGTLFDAQDAGAHAKQALDGFETCQTQLDATGKILDSLTQWRDSTLARRAEDERERKARQEEEERLKAQRERELRECRQREKNKLWAMTGTYTGLVVGGLAGCTGCMAADPAFKGGGLVFLILGLGLGTGLGALFGWVLAEATSG
jgi:hypothetical protein